jgi:hypothetical protein
MASLLSNWPGVDYKEVRAYGFNQESKHFISILTPDGLHPSVQNTEGVLLNKNQITSLINGITTTQGQEMDLMCGFVPRHGFVFYGENNHPIAKVAVCFECWGIEARPGIKKPVDFEALHQLCNEIGLPVI